MTNKEKQPLAPPLAEDRIVPTSSPDPEKLRAHLAYPITIKTVDYSESIGFIDPKEAQYRRDKIYGKNEEHYVATTTVPRTTVPTTLLPDKYSISTTVPTVLNKYPETTPTLPPEVDPQTTPQTTTPS